MLWHVLLLTTFLVAQVHAWQVASDYYGYTCTNQCLKRGYDYYHCYTSYSDRSYCSPMLGITTNGHTCRSSHWCDYHDKSYSWCYTDVNNNWDYCSARQLTKENVAMTRYGYYCTSECKLYSSGSYYYCDTLDGWEYCSPKTKATTTPGVVCKADSTCDRHGKDYYWCDTAWPHNSWNYCSPVSLDDYCTSDLDLSPPLITGPAAGDRCDNICVVPQTTRRDMVVNYFPNNQNGRITDVGDLGRQYRRHASDLIRQWDQTSVREGDRQGQSGYTLVQGEGSWTIDVQGFMTRNNRRYANIQLQVGRGSNRVSLAGVAVLQQLDYNSGHAENIDFAIRNYRRALLESMNRVIFVFLDIEINHQRSLEEDAEMYGELDEDMDEDMYEGN